MKSLNLKNLIRHYDHDTATAILDLIKDGSIDRPRVSEGEKYLYIDTRILRAPYGVISMHEVKAACQANISGAGWGVYCYLLTCMSGRISPKGTEIGGRQIMNATGYSKPTVYRACDALIKAGLIRASNASLNRRAWLLCNPQSDEIQDQATDIALQKAGNEATIKSEVSAHNKAVNNPDHNPNHILRSEKQNSNTVIKSDTNLNYDLIRSNSLIGGIGDQQLDYNECEYDLIMSYLQKHYEDQHRHLSDANASETATRYMIYSKQLEEAIQADNEHESHRLEMILSNVSLFNTRLLNETWLLSPYKIADDLTNRRDSKTCLLRMWGWDGTQSTKKLGGYIKKFAQEKAMLSVPHVIPESRIPEKEE